MRRSQLFLLLALSALLAGCAGAASGAPGATGAVTASPAAAGATVPSRTPALTATLALSATPQPSATPNQTATPTPCAETSGRMSSARIPSATLRADIDVRIYLPPCYAASDQRYPVLYLIHGLNFTEDQWERLGVPVVADELIASGEIAPLIVVMPRDEGDSRFDPAFVDDLLPFVDANYRTLADREHRAIGGLSRGAGWSVRLGLHYPRLFSRIGAHSPALFYGDENWLIQWMNAISKTGEYPAFYMDIGQGDARPQSIFWLEQHLTWFKFGQSCYLRTGDHSEKYWSTHLPEYLRFYAANWLASPVAPTTGAPEGAPTATSNCSPAPSATPSVTSSPTSTASATP